MGIVSGRVLTGGKKKEKKNGVRIGAKKVGGEEETSQGRPHRLSRSHARNPSPSLPMYLFVFGTQNGLAEKGGKGRFASILNRLQP